VTKRKTKPKLHREFKTSLGYIVRPCLKQTNKQTNKNPARCRGLTPVILDTQEVEIKSIRVESQPWANSSSDTISKIPNTKKGLARVIELLPSKCKAQNLNPSTTKKKKGEGFYD
jgi:hypothetical protein